MRRIVMFGREKTNKMEKPGMTDSSPDSRELATENEEPVRGTESTKVNREVSRRRLLKGGGAALAGLTTDGCAVRMVVIADIRLSP